MSDKKDPKIVTLEDIEKHGKLKSKDRSLKQMPIDVLKAMYITTDDTVEELARRYKLSPSEVKTQISRGEWDKLRAENKELGLNSLKGDAAVLIEDLANIQKDVMQLKIMKLKEQIADVARYRVQHGSLKAVDPKDGSEVVDQFGNAYYIKLPGSANDIADMQNSITLMSGLMKILQTLVDDDKIKKLEAPEDDELTADKLLEYNEEGEKS
jgi:hypothetical protein